MKSEDTVFGMDDFIEDAPKARDGKALNWKVVSVAGVSAISLAAAPLALHASDEAASEPVEGAPLGDVPPLEDIPLEEDASGEVAIEVSPEESVVNDGMSFNEAFSTAREAMGPYQLFEWRGNIYSTCTVEEWEALHPAEEEIPLEEITDVAPEEVEVEGDGALFDYDEGEDVEVRLLGSEVDEEEDLSVMGIDGHGVLMLDVDLVEEEEEEEEGFIAEIGPDYEEEEGLVLVGDDLTDEAIIVEDELSAELSDEGGEAMFTNDADF